MELLAEISENELHNQNIDEVHRLMRKQVSNASKEQYYNYQTRLIAYFHSLSVSNQEGLLNHDFFVTLQFMRKVFNS